MALFFVAYDIDESHENEYEDLWNDLKSFNAKRVQKSVWALRSDKDATSLRDTFEKRLREGDRLLIIEEKHWSSFNSMHKISSI